MQSVHFNRVDMQYPPTYFGTHPFGFPPGCFQNPIEQYQPYQPYNPIIQDTNPDRSTLPYSRTSSTNQQRLFTTRKFQPAFRSLPVHLRSHPVLLRHRASSTSGQASHQDQEAGHTGAGEQEGRSVPREEGQEQRVCEEVPRYAQGEDGSDIAGARPPHTSARSTEGRYPVLSITQCSIAAGGEQSSDRPCIQSSTTLLGRLPCNICQL